MVTCEAERASYYIQTLYDTFNFTLVQLPVRADLFFPSLKRSVWGDFPYPKQRSKKPPEANL